MGDTDETPDKPERPKTRGRTGAAVPDAAFDLWLRRGLHSMFDAVAREPVPDELLRLINEDRKK